MATVDAVSSSAAAAQDSTSNTRQTAKNDLVSKDTFLQLLVAQIKNQNPLNPSDGIEYITELAQFTEVEQVMDIRSELEGLRNDLTTPAESKSQNGSSQAAA